MQFEEFFFQQESKLINSKISNREFAYSSFFINIQPRINQNFELLTKLILITFLYSKMSLASKSRHFHKIKSCLYTTINSSRSHTKFHS
jgi:hypothetical protein